MIINGINIETMMVGPIQTNCYIVHKDGSDNCIVIDPGEEAKRIAATIEKNHLNNEAILLTHGHFDHITGVSELLSLAGGKLYAYEGERELLADPAMNCSSMMGKEVALEPECWFCDKQKLELAGITFEVLHTPGHTSGSCCFYIKEAGVLFSGDTIFMESVGRTDFPTGSGRQIVDSIRTKILTLPDDVQIFTGHGPATSVDYEAANNPYA